MPSPNVNLDVQRTPDKTSQTNDSPIDAQLKAIAQRVKSGSPAEQAKAKQELANLRQRPEFQNPVIQQKMDQAEKGQEPQRDDPSSKTQHQANAQAQDFSGPHTELIGRFQSLDQGPNWQEKSGFFSRNPANDLAAKTQSRSDGGRESQRTPSGSQNPNQWTVANSSKSSPLLRQFLNEADAGQRPSDFLLNTMSFKMPEAMPQTSSAFNGFMAQPNATGAFGNLFKALSSGGETAAKAFMGRGFEAAPLMKIFENLSPEQQLANQLSQKPPVMVDIRNNFVFIKTKDGFHALRLEDDILHELPLEDESGKPLSPEEKKMILKILKEKGVDAKFSGDSEEILSMLGEADLAAGFEKFLLQKKGVGGKISKEDLFCLLLDAVLKGKLKLGTAGLEGDPLFPAKEDWLAFFANLGGLLGNKALSLSMPLEEILGLIFRGLFSKDGKNILVGDLKFLAAGEGEEAKMIQAEISDEAMEMLKNLLPGKTLDKAALEKLFGKELKFTELMHQEDAKANLAQTTLSGHATFEKSVLALRKEVPTEDAKTELSILLDSSGSGASQSPSDASVPANVYELLGLRKLYEGHPRLYSWVLYLTAGSILMITMFFIILNLL